MAGDAAPSDRVSDPPEPSGSPHHGRTPQIENLLQQWHAGQRCGVPVSVESLCGDNPALQSELRAAIEGDSGSELTDETSPVVRPQQNSEMPDRVGDFRIVGEIARGGSSVVFRAVQESLGREVAVKVLHAGDQLEKTLARFERELEALTRLKHPGITAVLDAGIVRVGLSTLPYIVMEYIEGVSLDRYVREHELDLTTRLNLFVRICTAVAAAHRQGIIHRDLKPSNILVTPDGRPHICDFGIARIISDEARTYTPLTSTREIIGTIQYMSPEHVGQSSGPIDTRSDIYSLGLILFELLTDQRAVDTSGQTVVQAVVTICDQAPPSVRQVDPSLPLDLATITRKATEKSPDQRYPTVDAFVADIQKFLRHEPISARRIGPWGHVWRWGRRRPAVAIAVLVAVLTIHCGTAVSMYYAWRAGMHADEADRRLQQLTLQSRELEKQTAAAESAAVLARRTAYNATLGRIHRFMVSDSELASELLEDPDVCPPAYRGFAWRYLRKQNRRLVRLLEGHPGGTAAVRFSADGSTVVSVGFDAMIRFWDTATGRLRTRIPCLNAGEPFAVSPSCDQVLSSGPEGTVIVFPARADVSQPHFTPQTGRAERACFLPGSSLIAVATRAGAVEVWDQKSREVVVLLDAGDSPVRLLHADERQLTAISRKGRVVAWERDTWEPLVDSQMPQIRNVTAIASQGNLLLTGRLDGRVDIYRHSGDHLTTMQATDGIRRVQFGFGEHDLVVAMPRRVEIHDWQTGEQTGLLRHGASEIEDIAVCSRPERQFIALASSEGQISLFNSGSPAARQVTGDWSAVDRLVDVACSPDGRLIAVLDQSGTCRLFAPTTLEQVAELALEMPCADLAWFPDSGSLAVATRRPGNTATATAPVPGVAVISVDRDAAGSGGDAAGSDESEVGSSVSMSVRTWWPPSRMVTRVDVSGDGRFVAAAARTDEVVVVATGSGEVISRLNRPGRGARAIDFSPDSRLLAVGCADGSLSLMNVTTGLEQVAVTLPRGIVQSCLFSKDGRQLITAGGGYGEIHLWTVPELKLTATFRGPRDVSKAAALSPDGETLAIASRDRMVTLMDSRTGDVQLELKAHTRSVTSLCFSPDGESLATLSAAELYLWEAPNRLPEP